MSNIEILMFFNWWKSSNGGGIKNQNLGLYRYLKNKTHLKLKVYFRKGFDKSKTQVPLNKFSCMFFLFLQIISVKPKWAILQGGIYSIIPCMIYNLFAGEDRIRIVHTFHSYPQKKQFNFIKFITGYILSKIDYPIFVSNNLKSKLLPKNLLDDNHYITINPGIEKHKKSNIRVLSGKEDTITILTVGSYSNVTNVKGFFIFYKAYERLAKENNRLRLEIAGEGKYLSLMKKLVSNSSSNNVTKFKGFVSNLRDYMLRSSFLVYPSLGTSFPLTIIEAMQNKCLILASKAGGLSEIIEPGKNGYLFENNSKNIYHVLNKAIFSNNNEDLVDNAFELFKNEFTSEICFGNYYKMLEKNGSGNSS